LIIKENVWIGRDMIILQGIVIEEGALFGALTIGNY
jgi:acetyltransferase-like isoleucine patch superfamily enzyme